MVKTFRYLKQTIDLKLFMNPSKHTDAKIRVEGYSDADWAGSRKDRKSISGGVTFLNGMPISRHVKKQCMVSLSTMEAEYVACSDVAKERLGIREITKRLTWKSVGHWSCGATIKPQSVKRRLKAPVDEQAY